MAKAAKSITPPEKVNDETLRAHVGYHMKRAFNIVQADLTLTLKPFELRMLTYTALALIVGNPGLSQAQLAQAMGIERPNLVVIVDELERRELIVRDYHANPEPPSAAQVSATLEELDSLSDNELLDFTTLARVFGYPSTAEAQDSAMSSRGYRAMSGISRLQFAHVDLLVRSFGSLQGLLAATASDLQSVEGIGSMWARHIREGLSQLAESTIADRLA